MIENNLTLTGICKSFRSKKILDDLSFEFKNSCYWIQGPNGIGKSTLLSIIAGSLSPDSGSISLNGNDFKKKAIEAKKLLSYIPDKSMAYPFMTGEEWLTFISRAKNCRINEMVDYLVEGFGLTNLLNHRFSELSLGNQKKFMLSATMIGNPRLIILDEPSNGLDSASCQLFIQQLAKIKEETIIIISTHDKSFLKELTPIILKMPISLGNTFA